MNRVRFLSKITLAAGFVLALAFTFSCSSDEGDSGDQIYYQDMSLYKGNGTVFTDMGLYLGKVNNGLFSFKLSDEPKNGYWIKVNQHPLFGEGITIDASDAEFYHTGDDFDTGYDIALLNNGEIVGRLMLLDFDDDDIIQVGFIYLSEDVSIKGKVENATGKYEVDIDGKKGWNKIYNKFREYSCKYETLELCLEAVREAAQANSNIIAHLGNITTYGSCLEALEELSINNESCEEGITTTNDIARNERWILLTDM